MNHKDGSVVNSELLPGDAVAGTHAHHLLDLVFGVIGKLGHFDTPCLSVPFENIGAETDARFAVGTFRSIDYRISLQYPWGFHGFRFRGRVSLFSLNGFLVLPREIVSISEARSEFIGGSFAVLSSAQAAPGLAAQLALFAIWAFFLFLRLGHFVALP